jgi:hypothetical protein
MDGIDLQSSREGSNPMTQRVTLTPVNPGDGCAVSDAGRVCHSRHTRPVYLLYATYEKKATTNYASVGVSSSSE